MLPEAIKITSTPGTDLLRFLNDKKYSSILVLMDENTQSHCYLKVKNSLPSHVSFLVKSGEENKTIETCTAIWQAMTDAKLDRHSVVVILGGGVLGDMGGFCASTYKRGIDFILMPTTLLAQADASIGGKLGIDFNHYKNHIGVFKEPALTLLHSGFLETLPFNELRSGFAEVIKHALISDSKLTDELFSKGIQDQPWGKLLEHSAKFKYSVIQKDPYEKSLRKILNAGHTIGHALESFFLTRGDKILHGEAIAAGLIAEAHIAVKKGLLDEASFKMVSNYLFSVFDKLNFQESEIKSIAALCSQDKKNKGNSVLCVLLNGIGRAQWDVEISIGEIEECLSFYRSI